MDNFTYNDDLLIRYLDGGLSEPEISDLEKKLQSDPDLKSRLESLQVAREAVIRAGIKEKVSSIHKEMMQEISSGKTGSSAGKIRHLYKYAVAAAAAVLLIFAATRIFDFSSPTAEKIYEQNYLTYVPVNSRSSADSMTSAIEKAYRDAEYHLVISMADTMLLKDTDRFFAGLAALETGRVTVAISYLEQFLKSSDSLKSGSAMSDAADQYLALAYLKHKDFEKALDLMNRIRQQPGHTYQKKFSEKLIRQVRKLR